jgi:peptidoglycan/LPS O-acetylase OafA/YrhL
VHPGAFGPGRMYRPASVRGTASDLAADPPEMEAASSERPERRLKGLDALRGIAVLAVVAFHVGVAPSGFLGVDIFFVLSGFLITSLVVGEFRRTGTVRLPQFYVRRALRLYPALLGVVVFVVAVAVVTHDAVRDNSQDAVATVLYVANLVHLHGLLDHAWTLALEEQFYLLWPALLLIALGSRRRIGYLPAVAVIAAVLVIDLAEGRAGIAHTYVRAMGLPIGCALALAGPWLVKSLAPVGPLALLTLVGLCLTNAPASLVSGWPVSAGALLAAPAVAWLSRADLRVFELLRLPWFGLRSYSIYLWHFPIISLVRHHVPGAVPVSARYVLAVIATLAAAELSFRLIETPVLHWRDARRSSRTAWVDVAFVVERPNREEANA